MDKYCRVWDKEHRQFLNTFVISVVNNKIELPENLVLSRWTQQFDSNKTPIYEGDIVLYHCPHDVCSDGITDCIPCVNNNIYVVQYEEELARFNLVNNEYVFTFGDVESENLEIISHNFF